MSGGFREAAPAAAAQIERIAQWPLVRYVNETAWIFAIIETTHLLFLAILGGSVLILNLRLLGAMLGEVPVRTVERATRPWLILGIAGTIATGIAMGLTTVNTLLASAAFLVKMVALVAAILFSLVVARAARHGGEAADAGRGGRVVAIVAAAWWIVSLALFATGRGQGAGAFLVALAGFALFAVFIRRWRRSYVLSIAAVLGGGSLIVAWFGRDGAPVPVWLPFAPLAGALAIALTIAAVERRGPGHVAPSATRLAAFASTLAWITVAAAGRWIGFS